MTISDSDTLPDVSPFGAFSPFATVALISVKTNIRCLRGACYFGTSPWAAARDRAELLVRTEEWKRQRVFSSAQAVAVDRMQIARELHDVVDHHVSVMGVQHGGASNLQNPRLPSACETGYARSHPCGDRGP